MAMMDSLPTPLLAGALVVVLALLARLIALHMRPMARRARRYASAREQQERANRQKVTQRERAVAWLDRNYARIGLHGADARRAFEDSLASAGLRGADSVTLYQAALLVMPSVGALLGYLVAPLLLADADGLVRAMVAAGGLALGAAAPRLWLSNQITKRQAALSRALPDALDLYVICAEAGLSLDAAMARVARELKPMAPPLAEELHLTAIELGFLPNRHEAYSNLLRRAPLPEFRGLVGMFQQTERYGTPLADALRQLAADYRTDVMMKAEEKAARLPAVLTVPMIVFVLPPLFIVLVGPAVIQLLGS